MKVRLFSDLHNEFSKFVIPHLPDDEDTILVLAGDIGIGKKPHTYLTFLEDAVNQFNRVIYIPGNHEYYHYGSFYSTWNRMKKYVAEHLDDPEFDKYYLHMVNDSTVVIDDVAFVCATLWTNFSNQNPLSMERARSKMNDYNYIRHGNEKNPYLRKFTPMDALKAHNKSKVFIFEEIRAHKAEGRKVVVVTHHGPSHMSIHEQYKNDPTNDSYVSEFAYDLLDLDDQGIAPELWVHGHVHNSFNYMIGSTRVVTNPRGYTDEKQPEVPQNWEFDPTLILEV